VFNLIVTHEPGLDNYRWVRNQVRELIGSSLRFISSYQSVILYDVDEDPHEIASRIRELLKDKGTPIIRIIPIDYVTDPYLEEVEKIMKTLSTKIPPNNKFRITLEGHLYKRNNEKTAMVHTMDAIRELAKYFNNPVDLTNPDQVIFIKVVKYMKYRRKAGISLLRPSELRRVLP